MISRYLDKDVMGSMSGIDNVNGQALANLVDFHVEFDDKRPNYRKVVAVSMQISTSDIECD